MWALGPVAQVNICSCRSLFVDPFDGSREQYSDSLSLHSWTPGGALFLFFFCIMSYYIATSRNMH